MSFKRERLLDVVAHLVDGDVEALVVHAVLVDARAQVRLGSAHGRAHGMARAARRIDHDVGGHVLRPLAREPELLQQVRDVLL